MKMSMRRLDYPEPILTPDSSSGEGATKTAPAGAVFSRLRSNALTASSHPLFGCRSLGDEVLVLDGLAALDDRDRQEFSAFHGEDRHLGVLAVAFFIERNPARRAREIDFLQNRQIFRRVGRAGLLHRLDQEARRVIGKRRIQDRLDVEPLLVGIEKFLEAACGGIPACEHNKPSAALPANSPILSVQAPSPKENTALTPSSLPCLSRGPAVESIPP